MATNLDNFVKSLPKVELHSHLEGSVRGTTVMELALRNGVKLHTVDPEEFYPGKYEQEAFFRSFFGVCEVLATPDDCSRAIYEVLSDAVVGGTSATRRCSSSLRCIQGCATARC